ncbi:MAG: L,D-transpeptidase [Microvirga sp.]|nr:L,D-transpeptidase [Microvirga sp.]
MVTGGAFASTIAITIGRVRRLSCLLALCAGLWVSPDPATAGELVSFDRRVEIGTIVVRTTERKLYLVVAEGEALRYKVGVGRAGRQWTGRTAIEGMFIRPNWAPPLAIRLDNPSLPDVISGDSPSNPMGAAALTLTGGEYAIHGTNAPGSIGGFVSYGCIRMHNDDILDLYSRVGVGTAVVVQE